MTSKSVQIKDNTYTLHIGYQDNEHLRKEFNRLTNEVWEFDFENFYQSGYWREDCILYSLFQEERIVSHITLSIFKTTIANQTVKIGQLGTVMTDPDYQYKGLSRFLLEYIETEYKSILSGYFLFANDTVLNFYPKFGYSTIEEYQATWNPNIQVPNTSLLEKLDLDNPASLALFQDYVENGFTYNTLNTANTGLTFFYCYANPDFGFKDSVYYSFDLETVVIYQQEEDSVTIYAIYQKDHTVRQLDEIVNVCCSEDTKTVYFAFSPETEKATYSLYKEEEDITLMATKELIHLFADKQKMIASLSHT